MKIKISPLQRISGILLGVAVVILIFLITITGIFKNKYFYITQNDRYGIVENSNLKNNDEYAALYSNLISAFKGKKINNRTVTLLDERVENMYSEEEILLLSKISTSFTVFSVTSYILFFVSAALCVYTFIKEKRTALKGMGIYLIIFGVLGLVAVNILSYSLSPENLAKVFIVENQGLFIKNIFTEKFFADYLAGVRRFYDFISIIPLGLGYFLIKFSKKKNYTPDGEYMYQ